MTDALRIVVAVPNPPSANRLWRMVPGMRRPVLDRDYAAWLASAAWLAKIQNPGAPRVDCRFDVSIRVPISRRDTDNWAKALMDLLQKAGIVSNDGNMNNVQIAPEARADCEITLIERPDLGAIRKPAKPKRVGGGPPARPKPAAIKRAENLRARIPF